MQSIHSYFFKLSAGLMACAALISWSFQSVIAANNNAPVGQVSASALSNRKAITWGGTGDDSGQATVVDGSGNVYVSGYFNGTVDFNPGTGVDSHTSHGGRDVFLSKFDASGNFLWAKTWGGTNDERGEAVAVDSLGNVYVSGPFQGTLDFNPVGGASHTSNAGSANNIYLSKFDSSGNFQWVRNWGPSDGGAEGYGIAMDASDHIYVVGDFSGTTCDFNPWGTHDYHTNHPPTPGNPFGTLFDAYLSKFDSSGNFVWAKTWGGEGYDDGPGVAVDSLGNVYVGGMYGSQTINFDPAGGSGGLGHPAHDSGVLVDVFLSKFASEGTFQWVKTWGSSGTDEVGQTVTVDKSNNVYVGGRFGCINCDFNPLGTADLHSSHGNLDAFVSKYDSNGNYQWAKTWGGTDWDATGGLTTDSSNNVYVTGLFKNTVDLGSGSGVTSNGLWDAFLSKFDSTGKFQWAQTWGGTGNDGGNKLASDTAGNIYVPGWFTGTVDFASGNGGDIHTSNGLGDISLSIFNDTNTISGNVGIAGATLNYTDGSSKAVTADISGNYSLKVSYNWSGTVTPSKANYVFTPAQKTYSNIITNLTSENYAAALPGLSVSGINIVANGQPVRLRGVNMGDPFGARNPSWYPMYSIADYATLAQQWHANVVRISIFPTQWKNMDHATLLAGLAQEVNAALNNGMYVIISYHVIGWPNGFYQSACCGNAADTYDSSMSVATSFWTQMAQTYGSDTRIIFDLWNEPVHDSADWQHADPNPYWTELKSFYESLIQTVRNNGAKNIVLATGNSWANWLVGIKDNPLSDSKVVYAYHQYSVNGSNTAAEWNKNTGGLIGVKPVIVSEWGYEDADVTNPTWPGTQASCGDPFTQWMENNNLSNLAWMYHHDWTPALLKADGSLTLYGTFVKNYIFEKNNLPQNVIITDTWAVKVSPSANVTQLALQLGAQNLGQIGSLTGYYLFSIPGSSSQTNTVAAILASNSQVLWFEQQVAHQQSTRENANEESLAEIITATATMDDVQSQDNVDNASATNIPPASTQTAITIIESSPVPSQLPVFTQTIVPLLQVSPVPTQTPLVQIQPSSIPTTFIQSAKMAVLPNEPLLVPITMIRSMIPTIGSENNSSNGGTIVAILITLSLAAGGIIFTLRRVK